MFEENRTAEWMKFKVSQSAEHLVVQKNLLQNGLDSSTDFHALFKHSFRKKIVAPSTVKNTKLAHFYPKKIVR